jgi:uncharacterized protein (DUF58 family)
VPLSTAELFKHARRLEVTARRLVDDRLGGQYHSVFKGRGLVFSDVRPYEAGDDVRAIDWNITARLRAPHVKQFVEERDRTVNLVVDMSASMRFGSRATTKRELAAELAAIVAVSAIKNNDRVGLVIVTDKVELFVPPKQGRRNVMRVIGEILAFEPRSRGTDLAVGLEFLGRVARRRSLAFVISDFLAAGWERALRIAARRHELVPIVITDPLEHALPRLGLVQVEDLETGERVELDTSGAAGIELARRVAAETAAREAALRRLGLDVLSVRTDEPYVASLTAFFKARARRIAHA